MLKKQKFLSTGCFFVLLLFFYVLVRSFFATAIYKFLNTKPIPPSLKVIVLNYKLLPHPVVIFMIEMAFCLLTIAPFLPPLLTVKKHLI